MKDSFSPEEKLLRLIKSPKKQNAPIEQKMSPQPEGHRLPEKSTPHFSIKNYFPAFGLHKIIAAFFIASCLFLVVTLLWPLFGLKKAGTQEIKREAALESLTETKKTAQPLEFYRDAAKGRRIFGATTQESEKPASAVNLDISKDINLVGIITGDNPQAVIEDKKTNKTYYISKGQFIGEIQVQDIKEGKIIIEYRGQQFELYL